MKLRDEWKKNRKNREKNHITQIKSIITGHLLGNRQWNCLPVHADADACTAKMSVWDGIRLWIRKSDWQAVRIWWCISVINWHTQCRLLTNRPNWKFINLSSTCGLQSSTYTRKTHTHPHTFSSSAKIATALTEIGPWAAGHWSPDRMLWIVLGSISLK